MPDPLDPRYIGSFGVIPELLSLSQTDALIVERGGQKFRAGPTAISRAIAEVQGTAQGRLQAVANGAQRSWVLPATPEAFDQVWAFIDGRKDSTFTWNTVDNTISWSEPPVAGSDIDILVLTVSVGTGVSSFNGRDGAVMPASGDYNADQIADGSSKVVMTTGERTLLAQLGVENNQYILANGTRSFSGVVAGQRPTSPDHLATKQYVDEITGESAPYITTVTADFSVAAGELQLITRPIFSTVSSDFTIVSEQLQLVAPPLFTSLSDDFDVVSNELRFVGDAGGGSFSAIDGGAASTTDFGTAVDGGSAI